MKKQNSAAQEFCGRDIRLMDEKGVDATQPTFNPPYMKDAEMQRYTSSNYP